MFELNSKYDKAKIYAETIEPSAVGQVTEMINSDIGENAHVRIIPVFNYKATDS